MNSSAHFRLKALCLAVASACAALQVEANPVNPTVVHGNATFSNSGNTLTVTNTPNAIINWQQFGINANETVRFVQQSAASAVLNRVTGADPSHILGTLQSNGRVFLINPAGIMFGQGAVVDVAGLVASTLNITDSDFLNGRLQFNADRAHPGSVVNTGQITTPNGGFVYLIAPQVENSGVITTPSGEAILAAGNSVELVDSADPALRVKVSAQSQDVNLS
ncbi:partial Heme/hemopexin-binding protein, partial [Anaerolineae bacterium]